MTLNLSDAKEVKISVQQTTNDVDEVKASIDDAKRLSFTVIY